MLAEAHARGPEPAPERDQPHPRGGTVRVEARRRPGSVRLTVEDSGEGIPADSVERVFEPFWRGDSARSGDGAGLGLALAKRIVESLGGRIEVDGETASGARFAIELPERVTNP